MGGQAELVGRDFATQRNAAGGGIERDITRAHIKGINHHQVAALGAEIDVVRQVHIQRHHRQTAGGSQGVVARTAGWQDQHIVARLGHRATADQRLISLSGLNIERDSARSSQSQLLARNGSGRLGASINQGLKFAQNRSPVSRDTRGRSRPNRVVGTVNADLVSGVRAGGASKV